MTARATQSLFDRSGNRKYVVAREREDFVTAAMAEGGKVASFCATLAITGARISEVLALTVERVDPNAGALVFETLKQRKRGVFRATPVPRRLLHLLSDVHELSKSYPNGTQLWPWGRTTAWKHVKRVMKAAGIANGLCKPKALRHGFGVEAGQNGVQLNIVQRWMGHARMETTAIYANALGNEERALACRTWRRLEKALNH
jgi:integrase/recombinase XerD